MRKILARVFAAAAALSASSAVGDPPRFVDATAPAGLAHDFVGGDAFVVGGGVAAFDCDGDGRPELFLAGGDAPASFWRNVGASGGPVAFDRAPIALAEDDALSVAGAYPLDVDADGVLDLFVLRFGRNRVLRGLGDCAFEDATDALGLPDVEDYSAAFAADWPAGAPLPTLAIGNYVDRSRPLQRRGNCQSGYVMRPGSDGRYGAPEPLEPAACALSLLFVDWSGDGARDLRVANDRAYFDPGLGEQLFRIEPSGPRALGEADGWVGAVLWGMGLAARDLDGDARPEIAVTSMADNHLQTLIDGAAGPTFENAAFALGAMSHRPYVGRDPRPSTAWHVDFLDADNDGWDDLWIVKGNVSEMPRFAAFDPDSLLMGGPGGVFVERGFEAGIALAGSGRGGAAVDLNADGLLDLVVVNRNGPTRILQSVAPFPGRGAVAVALRQSGANRFAVGARVEARMSGRVRVFDVSVGGGHASGVFAPLHIGLGEAPSAEIRVRWPDGVWSAPVEVAAGETARIVRERVDGE